MAPGLDQHPLGGIEKDDRKVCKRGTDRHVPGVFFVARSVRHNEGALVRCKVTVGNVNGDALFPLRHEAVQKKRVVDLPAPGAHFGVQSQSLLLVCIEKFCVVENVANECRFSIVYAAAGNEFQKTAH